MRPFEAGLAHHVEVDAHHLPEAAALDLARRGRHALAQDHETPEPLERAAEVDLLAGIGGLVEAARRVECAVRAEHEAARGPAADPEVKRREDGP
jgi:hypothetical protein